MKLLSGTAPIAPKNFLLIALAIATLGIGLSPAALAQTTNAPTPKTEAMMLCRLGLGPTGCEKVFFVGRWDMRGIKYCNGPYSSLGRACPMGELKTVKYFGTQKDGYDVYDVKYFNAEVCVVIAPPGPDGKLHTIWSFPGPATQALPPRLLAITSPANPVQTLFRYQEYGT